MNQIACVKLHTYETVTHETLPQTNSTDINHSLKLTSKASSEGLGDGSAEIERLLVRPVRDTFDSRRFRIPLQLFGILKAQRLW